MNDAPNMHDRLFSRDVEENKIIAAIGYIFILFLIPLMLAKDSKFAQFHAKQAAALFILDIAVMFVNIFIGWIPIIGWIISFFLSLGVLILSLLGFLMAIQGRWYELPIVSTFAKRLRL